MSDNSQAVANGRPSVEADLAGATQRHRLPQGLLAELLRIERRQVGRFGAGGINVRFQEALEKADAARGAPGPGASPGASPRTPGQHSGLAPDVERDTMAELVSLKVESYRQFPAAELVFQRDAGRPVCIIEAQNGYGKSHLVEALSLALVHGPERAGLEERLHRTDEGGSSIPTVRVEVRLDTFEGAVTIRCIAEFQRGPKGVRQKGATSLTVVAECLDQPLQDREAQEWLEARWPPEVLRYFVFDAESQVVQRLAGQSGETMPDVRPEVEAALGVSVLRQARRRCEAIAKERRRVLKADSGDETPTSLAEQAAKLRAEAAAVGQEMDELAASREELAGEIRSLEKRLKGVDPAAARRDWSGLDKRLKERRAALDAARSRARAALTEAVPLALLSRGSPLGPRGDWTSSERTTGARVAVARIADAVAAGAVPFAAATERAEVVAALECIIGIPPDGATSGSSYARVLEAAAALPSAADIEVMERGGAEIAALERQLSARPAQSDDAQWRNAVTAAAAGLEQRRDALRELDEGIGRAKERLGALGDQVASVDKRLKAAKRSSAQAAHVRSLADLAERAALALAEAADDLLSRRIAALEREASRALRDVVHKRDLYERFVIDRDTLRYMILDADGNRAPPGRSSGERTLIALALVQGLRVASGLKFPLFIEAPLKTLDPIHQARVIDNFLCAFEGQTVLLVKPDELPDPASHALLRTRVSQRFRIDRDPSAGQDVSRISELPVGAAS